MKIVIATYFFSGQFFGATIFLLSLSSAMTVLIMRVHFSGEHGGKVPRWLRKVVLVCLARVVRMHKSAAETCKVRWSFHYTIACQMTISSKEIVANLDNDKLFVNYQSSHDKIC